ncbi:MAG: hypothetical protein R3C99_28585 [Pirellulaceae bacterium]
MSQFSPYQSPQFPNHAYAAPPAPRPGVYIGFAIYCGMLALLYLAVAALGVGLMVMSEQVAESDPELDGPMPVILMGVVMTLVGLVFAAIFAAGPLLPRKRWVWIYGIVVIAIGLTSICTLPFSVFLLIFWLKPEAKAYYGHS